MKRSILLATLAVSAAAAAAAFAADAVTSTTPPATTSNSVTANGVTTTTTTTTASSTTTSPAATSTTTTTTTTAETTPATGGSNGLTKEETELGEKYLYDTCSACHPAEQVTEARKSHDDWYMTVERMKDKGAPIEARDMATIAKYLYAKFPEPK